MKLTPELWQQLGKAISSADELPVWLQNQSKLKWESVCALPPADSVTEGQFSLPEVEKKRINRDYLTFLRDQITKNARGPEWLMLLRKRLAALEPWVGQELIVATFRFKPHLTILRIHPEKDEVIHVEVI
jgi:hypothetical protein